MLWHAICKHIYWFGIPTNPGKGVSRARRLNSVTAEDSWT